MFDLNHTMETLVKNFSTAKCYSTYSGTMENIFHTSVDILPEYVKNVSMVGSSFIFHLSRYSKVVHDIGEGDQILKLVIIQLSY